MTVSLRPGAVDEKRQCRRNRRSDPFAHEDAWELCIGRNANAIGKRVGLSGRTIRQYREKYDTDHRNPTQLVEDCVNASRDLGSLESDAVAPARALCERIGYRMVPIAEGIESESIADRIEQVETDLASVRLWLDSEAWRRAG